MAQPYVPTSHEAFTHDSIDSLGYDWERVANPGIAPRYPFKVYLPVTTEDIVAAVRETRQLGQRLVVRSKGHSSNDLVLADRGHVLCVEKLNRILALDASEGTVTVQAGAVLADVDAHLAGRGLGLPIIGDHNHITAGGFASVGGISPASHRYGLFADNVRRLQYVTGDGEVRTCGRDDRPDELYRVLAGLGRHGIIATLTLDVIRIDKHRYVLRNDRALFTDVNAFVRESQRRIADPGEARMERGVWFDYPALGRTLRMGQFSSYYETAQGALKSLRNTLAYRYLHGLGWWAGRLPAALDRALKLLGIAGVMVSPRYASTKNVETFTDRVLDSSVGDPTRMFIALAPAARFSTLFHRIYGLFLEYRKRTGCFTFITIYVKAIRSPYLAGGGDGRYSELMVYCGLDPDRMTAGVTESLVSRLDDLCIEEGALRYMHSKTVADPERRRRIDPNAPHANPAPALAEVG
jgi:hypothetical protein